MTTTWPWPAWPGWPNWVAQGDQAALDQACDVCLSYTDIDLGIRGRAIGLLARVLYPDLPSDPAASDS